MADQRCLCPSSVLVGSLRDDALRRALRALDDAGELDAAERDAAAALADRLAVRLVLRTTASCPRHAPSAARPADGDRSARPRLPGAHDH